MPLDRSRGLLFVHVPKTAGTSIERALGLHGDWRVEDRERLFGLAVTPPADGVPYGSAFLQHLTWLETRKLLGSDALSRLRSFSVVRNPWDRLVSVYANPDAHLLTRAAAQGVALAGCDFATFVERAGTIEHAHLRPQRDYLVDETGAIRVEAILRFESLAADFEALCGRLGLEPPPLPHANRSAHAPYADYYDERTRALVAERFAVDIEAFGYRFATG